MWKEFKEFAFKSNAMELAIAVVLGAAFNAIVTALVNDLIMPVVGVLLGGVDFSSLIWTVGEAQLKYGLVIQQIVNFILIAFSLFIVVRTMNKFRDLNKDINTKLLKQEPEEPKPAPPTEAELLTEIRDLLKEEKQVS
jgi:large conductance mechanosensitive channel